jgi:hypothetical protein
VSSAVLADADKLVNQMDVSDNLIYQSSLQIKRTRMALRRFA